jgi:hypothetical protein
MGKVVVWGLKSEINSFKFIHSAFYRNFLDIGFETIWVDNLEKNSKIIERGDIVIAVDVASHYMPVVRNAKYILHNISAEKFHLDRNFLIIQTHTKSATGEKLGIPYVHWDASKRTLFQPWGVPTHPKNWKRPNKSPSSNEYWVGSIWNNEFNQGNAEFIHRYVNALAEYGIKFSRRGTSSRLERRGISESKSMRLVNKSAIGAAVVGEWQRENNYIPDRLFKNIASGAIASSNADFSELFGTRGGVFNSDPKVIIGKVIEMKYSEKVELADWAQERILPYTYHASIQRILNFLFD